MPSRRLIITVRRFKPAKHQRSHKYRQLIIHLYLLPIKQIAFRQEKIRRRGNRRPAYVNTFLQKQNAISAALIVMGIVGAFFFGMQADKINASHKIEPAKTFGTVTPAKKTPVTQKFLPRSEPTHLAIPSVGIDVSVTPVGKASDNTIEMPPLFDWTTGWYKYSPTPGEIGPAIIVGHVDTYKGISVFWRLRDVMPGDIVQITRADNKVVKFKVDALKQFDQASFPTKEVYGNIDHAGLRLITCGGAFDTQTAQYTQNTVVYASMVT